MIKKHNKWNKLSILMASLTAIYLAVPCDANAIIYAGLGYGIGGQTAFEGSDHLSMDAKSYSVMAGLDFPLLIRAEVEYNHLNTNNSHMNIGMANAYFKLPMILVTPYIGGGIGGIMGGSVDSIDTNTTMAYQGMLGLTFKIPLLPIKLDAEGRALYASNYYTIQTDDGDIRPNFVHYDFRIKARYVF